jgi:hypothetical protein
MHGRRETKQNAWDQFTFANQKARFYAARGVRGGLNMNRISNSVHLQSLHASLLLLEKLSMLELNDNSVL